MSRGACMPRYGGLPSCGHNLSAIAHRCLEKNTLRLSHGVHLEGNTLQGPLSWS